MAEVRYRPSSIPLVIAGAIVVAVVVWLVLTRSGGDAAEEAEEPIPTPTPIATADPVPIETFGTEELTAIPGQAGQQLLVSAGDTPWLVDLGSGEATALRHQLGSYDALIALDDSTALAALPEAGYRVLSIEDGALVDERDIDIGLATSSGARGVSPDGRDLWVTTRLGFLRYDVETGQSVQRWVDFDGDFGSGPELAAVLDDGMVAAAPTGELFWIGEDGFVEPLGAGEVLGGDGQTLLLRVCDADLQCNRFELLDLVTREATRLPELVSPTDGCVAATDDQIAVIGSTAGRTRLLLADGTDLEIARAVLDCLELHWLDDRHVALTHPAGVLVADVDGSTWEMRTTDLGLLR